jgi:hypothetical protein
MRCINWMTAERGIDALGTAGPRAESTAYVNHDIRLWCAYLLRSKVAPGVEHACRLRVKVNDDCGADRQHGTYVTLSKHMHGVPGHRLPGRHWRYAVLALEVGVYMIDHGWLLDDQPMAAHTLVLLPNAAHHRPDGARDYRGR